MTLLRRLPYTPATAAAPRAPARSEEANIHALLASLPLSAATTLMLARLIPVRFGFEPNVLGIVSATTQARYPKQQDIFWFAFGIITTALLTTVATLLLQRRAWRASQGILIELLGATALLAVLCLSPLRGAAVAIGCALAIAAAAYRAEPSVAVPEAPPRPPPAINALGIALWILALIPVCVVLSADALPSVYALWKGFPDAWLTQNTFWFMAEAGQHLAWSDRFLHGQLPGRDYFCLYGPFFDLGLVAHWRLLGRSLGACSFYFSELGILGHLAVFVLALTLLRRRFLVLLIPWMVPEPPLRLGMGLFGLALIILWLRSRRSAFCAAAGAVGGAALLFSQEFGAAFLLTAALALTMRRDWRAAAAFLTGFLVPVAPTLAAFASHGALSPMLRDLASYPAYLTMGFGALPFPSLLPWLPIGPGHFVSFEFLPVRLGYVAPFVSLAGLLVSCPLTLLDARAPLRSVGRALGRFSEDANRLAVFLTALYGLLSFRSALGRSDLPHIAGVLAVPAVLLILGLDRTLDLRASGRATRWIFAWRLAAIALLAWSGAFFAATKTVSPVEGNFSMIAKLVKGMRPTGDWQVNAVAAWIRDHTRPSDPVLFIPADAAFYFLSGRLNPTRFDLSHQMVTDAHRAEAVADLRSKPPAWIVVDSKAWWVDDIPYTLIYGTDFLSWMTSNYEEVRRMGPFVILGPRRKRPG